MFVSRSGAMDQGNGNWNMMDLVDTLKEKEAYFFTRELWVKYENGLAGQ